MWMVLLINFVIDIVVFLIFSLLGITINLGFFALLGVTLGFMVSRIVSMLILSVGISILFEPEPAESYHKDTRNSNLDYIEIFIFFYLSALIALFVVSMVTKAALGTALVGSTWLYFVLAIPLTYAFIPTGRTPYV